VRSLARFFCCALFVSRYRARRSTADERWTTRNLDSILRAINLEVSVSVLRSTGDQFASLPHRLRRHALARRRRGRSGTDGRHRGRWCRTERRLASQSIGIGYVACLMPRVRVPPLRVLLALGRGRVLARLQARRVDIRPRDLQHSLDVGGLGPGLRERERTQFVCS